MLRREKRHDFVVVNDNEFCTAMRSSTKEIYEREKRAGSFTMKRRMKNSCAMVILI
jgi:formaldehyde-activating enzyme involved in methanogenesis